MLSAMIALAGVIADTNADVVEQLESSLLTIEIGQAGLRDVSFLARSF
ncbi:MAG: hypothetical protein ACI8Z1_000998 [Candidatus Azotimanducaceae bacterium]|jgi:hypothetical protein